MNICVQKCIKEVLLEDKEGKGTKQGCVFKQSYVEGSFILIPQD